MSGQMPITASLSYADPREGLEALRSTAALLPFEGWRRMTVRGADAVDYLHRRVSNSITDLAVGSGVRALQLGGDGRIEADLLVYRTADDALTVLTSPPDAVSALENIEKYTLMDDVEVTEGWSEEATIAVAGPIAPKILGVEEKAIAIDLSLAGAPCSVYRDLRWQVPYYHVIANRDELAGVTTHLAQECEKAEGGTIHSAIAEYFRIEQGIARFGIDTTTATIPVAAGLDAAIDFEKGCFPGQEVLARIRNLGHPAKVLVRLRWEGPVAGAEAKIFVTAGDEAKEAGSITSSSELPGVSPTVGLGWVRWEFAKTKSAKIQIGDTMYEAEVDTFEGGAAAK